jgi:hypothetical protein
MLVRDQPLVLVVGWLREVNIIHLPIEWGLKLTAFWHSTGLGHTATHLWHFLQVSWCVSVSR